MAYYDEFIELAQDLIQEFGRKITLLKYDGDSADSSLPWKGPNEPSLADKKDCSAAFVSPTGTDLSSMRITEDMLARCNDVCLVEPGDKDLTDFTAILDNNVKLAVQWSTFLKPGDQIILYAFGVKR